MILVIVLAYEFLEKVTEQTILIKSREDRERERAGQG